ncbi:hypothetical protein PLICBS_009518 [Purpureocillium lilacinum]|nr:hypothetical protein PLICBS_009518 [Purpureocillium lilacinum]
MAPAEGEASAAFGEDVKPYKIHVSTKYLDLTRQKLELTRLPHDIPRPRSSNWWDPKPVVEPLVDFWLEHFSWRDQEEHLNAKVPQFRTAINTTASDIPCRVHFIHARSPHANAIPLLLIPPFPFTNLSLVHLIPLFTEPNNAAAEQPFHLVIPSLPGMGFSDGLSNRAHVVPTVADMLDVLMKRLDYGHYLVSNSGPAVDALPPVDWRIASRLATHYTDSCLGAHFVSPPLHAPTSRDSWVEWAKWTAVSMFQTPMLGYSSQDIEAMKRNRAQQKGAANRDPAPALLGFGSGGVYEPNTLAYALCDSPLGLILFFLMIMRIVGPEKDLSPEDLIKLTELTWLPGPEGMMRLWAQCASCPDGGSREATRRARVGLTVFLGDTEDSKKDASETTVGLPRRAARRYACPAWANQTYNVVATNRTSGNPGLLVWERPHVIASGARALAKAILPLEPKLKPAQEPGAVLLEQVVVEGGHSAPAEISGTTIQAAGDEAAGARSESYVAFPKPDERDEEEEPQETGSPHERATRPVTPGEEVLPVRPQTGSSNGGGESSEGSPNTVIAIQVGA